MIIYQIATPQKKKQACIYILYHTVKGSAQAMQVALAHTMAQCNPTVKRGLEKQPKIKKLPKEQASDKSTQTEEKDKPH